MLRRCGLPAVSKVSIDLLVKAISEAWLNGQVSDMSAFWMAYVPMDQLDHPDALCTIPNIEDLWLVPMQTFCRARQPGLGTSNQRAQVCDLLCRCGWASEPRALWLVLKILGWDTVELLHFALQLLRQQHAELWLPLAAVLEQAFGSDAVLPLRKALDPQLTLALVVAAPEHVVR